MDVVDLSLDGPIASLVLRNPPGNRINFQMRTEILNALELVARSEARALVLTGDGDDFCLGGDIRDWTGVPSAELRPRIEVLAQAIDVLETLPIPTVAAVRGACVGGGFELTLGCDAIVAASDARFVFPESSLGLMTLQGGVYQLAGRIGHRRALEVVMLSTPIDAQQMADWNVVAMVAGEHCVAETAAELAGRLAARPAEVYARTKTLLRLWQDKGRPAARKALYDLSMPLFDSPAVQHALSHAVAAMRTSQPSIATDELQGL